MPNSSTCLCYLIFGDVIHQINVIIISLDAYKCVNLITVYEILVSILVLRVVIYFSLQNITWHQCEINRLWLLATLIH